MVERLTFGAGAVLRARRAVLAAAALNGGEAFPPGLVAVACGAARELLGGQGGGRAEGAGTTAFVFGFMLGAELRGGTGALDPMLLSDAIEGIGARGPLAVIADACDLGAVASCERLCAGALVARFPDGDAGWLTDRLGRLFETGLAVALLVAGLEPVAQ